jgi:hypothetical protein
MAHEAQQIIATPPALSSQTMIRGQGEPWRGARSMTNASAAARTAVSIRNP